MTVLQLPSAYHTPLRLDKVYPQFASPAVPGLVGKRRPTLLPILVKRLIVGVAGEIVDYELNIPFTYLHQITEGQNPRKIDLSGSDHVRLGASPRGAPFERRSSASNPSSEECESPWSLTSLSDVEASLAGLRFEKRSLLGELPVNFLETTLKLRF